MNEPVDFAYTLSNGTTLRSGRLFFIAGPCVIEGEDQTLRLAERIRKLAETCGAEVVFKASFDKANRTSLESFRGPGLAAGLSTLARVRDEIGVPILTDVHEPPQAAPAGEVADVIQIPAFLCRQTDLLVAAARTGRVVNIKKGQFLAPWDMPHTIRKVIDSGNERVIVTERGSTFGYNNLVVDFRSIPYLRNLGHPVVFDCTHAVQQPGGQGPASGGQSQYAPVLARAAAAAGADGIFIETHEDPAKALSDGPNMIRLADLADLFKRLLDISAAARS